MHLDIVDVLRCPADHEQVPVVAVPDRLDGRQMISGTIGCPLCGAEYEVADGVLRMRAGALESAPASSSPPGSPDDADFALRIAAMMDLTPGRAFGVIAGAWGAHAPAIRSITPTPLVLIDPPDPRSYAHWEKVTVILADALPFLDATVPSIALSTGAGKLSGRLASVAAPRSRVIMSSSDVLPQGLTELARDEHFLVAERQPEPLVLAIGRRPPASPGHAG